MKVQETYEADQRSLGRSRLTYGGGHLSLGPHMVEVTPGDIRLAEGNPDTAFTAIHPDFYMSDTPYLLTGGPASGWSAEPVDRQPSVSRWHSLAVSSP